MLIKTNAVGLPHGWNTIVQDSCRTVTLFVFYSAPAATKYFVFKLLKDVCSDFTQGWKKFGRKGGDEMEVLLDGWGWE